MADVQIAVIDPEDTQLALAAPAEAVVNVAVPGVQGPIGLTGSVAIAQDGTAATPGIRFESDTNTGIYRPGADQLAISTGGTGRLFVDSAGKLSIGTTSSSINILTLKLPAGNANQFTIAHNNEATYGRLDIGLFENGVFIGTYQGSNSASDLIRFGTNGTERFRITSAGLVGIGTTSPDALLHVATASGTASQLRIATGGASSTATLRIGQVGAIFWDQQITTTSGNYLLKIDGGGDAYRVERSGSAVNTHVFSTAGSERARIDSSGRLGIGTSSPGTLLDVVNGIGRIRTGGKAGSNAYLKLESTDASNSMELQFSNSTNASWSIQSVENGVSNRSLLLNPAGGNVGIGTASPQKTLHVAAGSSGFAGSYNARTAAIIESSNSVGAGLSIMAPSTGQSNLAFGDESNEYAGLLAYEHSSDAIRYLQSGQERARLDSSGRLLVGTSSARGVASANASLLEVETNTSALNISCVRNTNDGAGGFVCLGKSRGVAIGSVTVVQDSDILGEIRFAGADGTDLETMGASISAQVDGTPGANDMPGRLVFSTTADGAASPTERLRITSAGVLQVADAGNITVGTTTGTKIGTATTQKLGFYNATPVVQPTAVADATDAASAITQLNALLTRMRNLGLIAT